MFCLSHENQTVMNDVKIECIENSSIWRENDAYDVTVIDANLLK